MLVTPGSSKCVFIVETSTTEMSKTLIALEMYNFEQVLKFEQSELEFPATSDEFAHNDHL